MLIEIDKVIVKERIRKDFGDIEELANDIKENGLINPPVVTPEYELIAGERRLRALQHLDYKQIEVRVMTVQDALHQLKLEISENENRKDFSFSEKMKWAEELNEYSKIAKKNQLSGLNNQSSFDQNLSNDKIDTNKQIAKDLELGSKETYRQAQYIYNNADEETIKQLDDGQLSINKAYITLKEQLNKAQQELRVEKNKPREIITETIDNTDYTVVNKLKSEKRDLELKVIQLQDKVSNNNITYKDSPKTINEINKLKEKIRQKDIQIQENELLKEELNEKRILVSKFIGENTNIDLISTTSENRKKMMDFLQDMSKYDYLSQSFNDIPDATRKEWVKAIYGVFKWSKSILEVVKHDDIIGVDTNIIDADYNIN